jgi:hypothetical protein
MADGSYGMGGGPVPEATKQWLWGFLCGVVASIIVVLFFTLVGCTTPPQPAGGDLSKIPQLGRF